MKKLELGNTDKCALIDDEDYAKVSQKNWRLDSFGHYVVRCEKGKTFSLHRVVMEALDEEIIDHKNHDRLDNRKENLRRCTGQQNHWNMRQDARPNQFGYKGVVKLPSSFGFRIRIGDGQRVNRYGFETPEDAAYAYNLTASRYHGEFANLNQI